ncbi:MAG: UDP-N-acetylmuramyl pentapeptide phosphotransferase [Alphaproteobacteria bacterium]|nr:UDP-N-acetylmuramyl pentapeptide phosphotransferase [Alphaproteobacteria bacterium]
MAGLYILIVATIAGILSWALIGLTRRALLRHQLLDHPNERSSHTLATPRGGGLGLLAVLLPAWVLLTYLAPSQAGSGEIARWLIPGGALLLAGVSFLDDLRGLSQTIRLLVQAIGVITAVQFLPAPIFQGLLPPLLDTILAVLIWLWFINLFNFMDGIDGITGVEAIGIGIGIYAIGAALLPVAASHGQALVIATTMIGFLVWNWQPARIFIGDVGSIPLGFLLGWLLLNLAASGLWQAALILPLYYLADASLTLIRRLLRGAVIWHAHREHCYQQAVQRGRSHAAVSGAVALTNLLLVGLAFVAAAPLGAPVLPWLMLAGAAIVVALLMAWMVFGGKSPDAETAI